MENHELYTGRRSEVRWGVGEILNGKVIKVCYVILPLTN